MNDESVDDESVDDESVLANRNFTIVVGYKF